MYVRPTDENQITLSLSEFQNTKKADSRSNTGKMLAN